MHILHRELGRDGGLSLKPFPTRHGGLRPDRRGINIVLEHLRSPWHDEGDRLNVRIIHGLKGAHDLIVMRVHAALGHERHPALRLRALVLGQRLELVVLQLVVPDVAVALAGDVKHIAAVVPEGHAHARAGVEERDVAADGLGGVADVPEPELTLAHFREAGGGYAVLLAHPDAATVLRAGVTSYFVGGFLLPHVPEPQLLVARSRHHHAPVRRP